MQRQAENAGRASKQRSHMLEAEFTDYLRDAGLEVGVFRQGKYKQYMLNADLQLPRFIDRLTAHFPGHNFEFVNVEKEYRNLGMKADFLIYSTGLENPIPVSLKNYIGQGGILRPQVSAGTFHSFILSFLFDRAGVGIYRWPDDPTQVFKGSSVPDRDRALAAAGNKELIPLFHDLDLLQLSMREEFLGPECEMYDKARVTAAARRIAQPAIEIVLNIFQTIGLEHVREVVLDRVGFDGKEDLLFFDAQRSVDSITNPRFHDLKNALLEPSTRVEATHRGQSIQFQFLSDHDVILTTDVPFTINTNGAWYRPKDRYEGTRTYNDKGHEVNLVWGQRRPYKSREIATSINTYVNLGATGIFSEG
jgi:hypothetical protein